MPFIGSDMSSNCHYIVFQSDNTNAYKYLTERILHNIQIYTLVDL